ncbi:MAG: pyridoxal 5'-phosphate synthase glutaminase subunit PdxT [Candidatus Bipolaricaulota bacterium]
MRVGVLGLQGAVREHVRSLTALEVESAIVKRVDELSRIDALILPGGESTAMALLAEGGLLDALRAAAARGLPMFGTCAGMILLAREVQGRAEPHIGAIDVAVARNASGRQVHSFETTLDVDGIGPDVPAVFIRAPFIVRVGPGVKVLARHEGVAVMAEQGMILVASFHPELTGDLRIHRAFVDRVRARSEGGRG